MMTLWALLPPMATNAPLGIAGEAVSMTAADPPKVTWLPARGWTSSRARSSWRGSTLSPVSSQPVRCSLRCAVVPPKPQPTSRIDRPSATPAAAHMRRVSSSAATAYPSGESSAASGESK